MTKTIHQTFTHFERFYFYVDTLVVYNLHIKFQYHILPTEEFLKLRVIPALSSIMKLSACEVIWPVMHVKTPDM